MKKIRKYIAALTAVSLILSCAACGSANKDNAETSASADTAANDTTASGNAGAADSDAQSAADTSKTVFRNWADVDRNALAAYLENPDTVDDPDYFNITFGDFFGEWQYFRIIRHRSR